MATRSPICRFLAVEFERKDAIEAVNPVNRKQALIMLENLWSIKISYLVGVFSKILL